MSSPQRMQLMEQNVAKLAAMVKQLGEMELANQQWRLRSDQRLRESEQRTQELAEQMQRIQESNAAQAENIRAMLNVITEMQIDIARIDAAS